MKKRRQSRTLWFNGIMAALIALEASLHYLSSLIPANWYAIIAVVLSVGNAILRVITTTGISK